jgi:hypothetical protein
MAFFHAWLTSALEGRGQLHASSDLSSEKQSPVPTEWEAGWSTEPVCTL